MHKIKQVIPLETGFEVHFQDIDMVAFVHKEDKEAIADLQKKGFIKPEKKVSKKRKK